MKFTRPLFAAVVIAIAGGLSLATVSQAGEKPMKGRFINLKSESNCTKVEDVEGHVICTFELPSVGILGDGEYYSRIVKGTIDYVKGVGKNQGYTISTFADGSTWTDEWEGSSKLNDQKVMILEGTYSCTTGTGRYSNIKCKGTWRSSVQKGGFSLGEYEGTMTLPD